MINFPVAKDTDVVPRPKLGYKGNRMYTTSTDSGRHHASSAEYLRWRAITGSGDNLATSLNNGVVLNLKQAYVDRYTNTSLIDNGRQQLIPLNKTTSGLLP